MPWPGSPLLDPSCSQALLPHILPDAVTHAPGGPELNYEG